MGFSALRLCLLLLCLSASMAQTWTAQVHLHGSVASLAGETLSGEDGGVGEHGGTCLLCQIASHGSVAPLHPAAPDPSLRSDLGYDRLVPPSAASGHTAPSHHWFSRGPPRG